MTEQWIDVQGHSRSSTCVAIKSTYTVMLSLKTVWRQFLVSWSWGLVSWSRSRSWDGVSGKKTRQSDNQETTPSASSSSAPPQRKWPALLSYARPPVLSDTSAALPDATLAAYITAINQDDYNPDDRPNTYAQQKYIALWQRRELIIVVRIVDMCCVFVW